jgi:tetratricopeptide (TPR) repeat protein
MKLFPEYYLHTLPGISVVQQSAHYEELSRIAKDNSNEISQSISISDENLVNVLASGNESLKSEINWMTNQIGHDLQIGFADISFYLEQVSNDINKLSMVMRLGFAKIEMDLIAMELKLQNIVDVLKLPERLKDISFFFSEGLKFYETENYNEAIELLSNAQKIYDKDYLTGFFLAKAKMDDAVRKDTIKGGFDSEASALFNESKQLWTRVIKYADIDIKSGGHYMKKLLTVISPNYLRQSAKPLEENFFLTRAMMWLGICQYRLGEFDGCINTLDKLVKQEPSLQMALLYLIKSNLALAKTEDAWVLFKKRILLEPQFSGQLVLDTDIRNSKLIQKNFIELSNSLDRKNKDYLFRCNHIIQSSNFPSRKATKSLQKYVDLSNSTDFLARKQLFDQLNTPCDWPHIKYILNEKSGHISKEKRIVHDTFENYLLYEKKNNIDIIKLRVNATHILNEIREQERINTEYFNRQIRAEIIREVLKKAGPGALWGFGIGFFFVGIILGILVWIFGSFDHEWPTGIMWGSGAVCAIIGALIGYGLSKDY